MLFLVIQSKQNEMLFLVIQSKQNQNVELCKIKYTQKQNQSS
jgi:hypothetical protein